MNDLMNQEIKILFKRGEGEAREGEEGGERLREKWFCLLFLISNTSVLTVSLLEEQINISDHPG